MSKRPVLTPTAVSPQSILARKKRKPAPPVRKQIKEVKQIFDWTEVQNPHINGLVQRRGVIRALEGYLDQAPIDVFHHQSFSCGLSRLRTELRRVLVLAHDDQEVRQTFFVNDIINYAKVLTNQSTAQHFHVEINPAFPKVPTRIKGTLKLFLIYRGVEMTLKQSMDGTLSSVGPYGAVMIKGTDFHPDDPALLEWTAHAHSKDAFLITLEAAQNVTRSIRK